MVNTKQVSRTNLTLETNPKTSKNIRIPPAEPRRQVSFVATSNFSCNCMEAPTDEEQSFYSKGRISL